MRVVSSGPLKLSGAGVGLTHVYPLCAAVHHAFDLVAEVGKVAGEDRGRDDRLRRSRRHRGGVLAESE
jgi:hypothetical protein